MCKRPDTAVVEAEEVPGHLCSNPFTILALNKQDGDGWMIGKWAVLERNNIGFKIPGVFLYSATRGHADAVRIAKCFIEKLICQGLQSLWPFILDDWI